jgi:uncharacterized membrane protein YczE
MWMKKILRLIFGIILSSFAITMVINAGLGVFPITSANLALSNWLGVSMGVAGMLVELAMLIIAYKMGEGLTLTGILNATVGSLLIDVWSLILPKSPIMILGIFLLPIAWFFSSGAGLGDTNQNLVQNAILKRTNKNIGFVRMCQEVLFMGLGLLGAREYISPLTIILSLGFGYIIQFEYKLLKYEPQKVEHSFLIKGK